MEIYFLQNGIKLGPYSATTIDELVSTGVVSPKAMGWHQGISDWIPLGLIIKGLPRCKVSKSMFRALTSFGAVVFIFMGVIAIIKSPDTPYVEPTVYDNIHTLTLLCVVIGNLASYVGLLLLKQWGRKWFLFANIVITFGGFTEGCSAASAIENGCGTLYGLLSGAIIAISYSTVLFDSPNPKQVIMVR